MNAIVKRQEMSNRLRNDSSEDERIRTGFEASIKNYAKADCILFYQSSLSLISSLPYSKSINHLLLFYLFA